MVFYDSLFYYAESRFSTFVPSGLNSTLTVTVVTVESTFVIAESNTFDLPTSTGFDDKIVS